MPGPYRWLTDPPGKPPSHTKSYNAHLAAEAEKKAKLEAQQAAYEQNQGNAIAQYGAQYAAGKVGANGAPLPAGPGGAVNALATAPVPPAPPPTWAPDSGYNDAVAIAKRRYEAAIGGVGAEERATRFEYGFDDPTNPFSRVNEAKRAYLNRGRQLTGNLAARGQLYSGVHQARLDVNRRDEDKTNAATRAAYAAALAALQARRTGAQTTREEEELRARLESMGRQGVS